MSSGNPWSCDLYYMQLEEARLQKEVELQEKRIRKEFEKQEVQRRKVILTSRPYMILGCLGKSYWNLAYDSEPPLVLLCGFVFKGHWIWLNTCYWIGSLFTMKSLSFSNIKCALVQREEQIRKEQDKLELQRKREEERIRRDRLKEQERVEREQKKEAERLEKESKRVRVNREHSVSSIVCTGGYQREFPCWSVTSLPTFIHWICSCIC